MHDGLGQEWMHLIIVNDFPALYNAESRANLRIYPPAGLGGPDRNGVCAIVAGKSISLRCSNTNIPIMRIICNMLCRRAFRDITLTIT